MKYSKMDWGRMEAVINKLGGYEGVDRFLNGQSEIVVRKHLIDCDITPFCPDGWTVEAHTKGGQLELDLSKIVLHFSKNQMDGKTIEGNKLRKELEGLPVLNANVLDYLLKNPNLIPEEWKGKAIFFWGTVYRFSRGSLCVRCLYWDDGRWRWDSSWLSNGFDDRGPAAVSAS